MDSARNIGDAIRKRKLNLGFMGRSVGFRNGWPTKGRLEPSASDGIKSQRCGYPPQGGFFPEQWRERCLFAMTSREVTTIQPVWPPARAGLRLKAECRTYGFCGTVLSHVGEAENGRNLPGRVVFQGQARLVQLRCPSRHGFDRPLYDEQIIRRARGGDFRGGSDFGCEDLCPYRWITPSRWLEVPGPAEA